MFTVVCFSDVRPNEGEFFCMLTLHVWGHGIGIQMWKDAMMITQNQKWQIFFSSDMLVVLVICITLLVTVCDKYWIIRYSCMLYILHIAMYLQLNCS